LKDSTVSDESVLSLLRQMGSHLSRRRKLQVALLAILTILSAFSEFLSLGAILPFLAALVAPDQVFRYPVISWLIEGLRLQSSDQVVLVFALLFIAVMLLAAAVRLALTYGNTRIAIAIGADLASEAYRRTLYQPYQEFVKRNSSALLSNIEKSNAVANGFVLPLLTVIGSCTIIVAVLFGLFLVDPVLMLTICATLGLSYSAIAWFTTRRLLRNGRVIADNQTQRIKAIQEGLGGFRDIALSGTQELYCGIYRETDRPVRWAQGMNAILTSSPRIVIEALSAVVLALVAYLFSRGSEDVATVLPVLGVLAFGAQRLMPMFQQLYGGWSGLMGARAQVADSLGLLDQGRSDEGGDERPRPQPLRLGFDNSVSLRGVRFRYSDQEPWVLDGVNLDICKGEHVGLMGRTGCGKSTLLDVFMGLLTPTDGDLLIDGQKIRGDRRLAWSNSVAHVPQDVFLADISLAENIAFGVPAADIDWDLVEESAELAELATVIAELPKGLNTELSERGIRLSGGQRQRIGLARALYRQRDVLVLDEATSALDGVTEARVHRSLTKDLTIVLVSHRLDALSMCDRWLLLADGRVSEVDRFDDSGRSNPVEWSGPGC